MQETKMTHCPKCHKPLLNGGQFSAWAQFTIRCAWCQAVVQVSVQPSISVSLKNGETVSQGSFDEPSQFMFNGTMDKSFDSDKMHTTPQMAGEGFKVVGYLYPQDGVEKKPPAF